MNQIQFPLDLTFKISTLSNDFVAKDANGLTIAYVRQKMLKLVEEIQIYSDDTRSNQIYTIKANKWLDFSASYQFTDMNGLVLGRVARKGWASIWKANYDIYNAQDIQCALIREENPWAKVMDSILEQIPLISLFSGYFFHPSYLVSRTDGTPIARLKKESSFFGRRFSISKLNNFESGEEEKVLLSLMMMILLERRRG